MQGAPAVKKARGRVQPESQHRWVAASRPPTMIPGKPVRTGEQERGHSAVLDLPIGVFDSGIGGLTVVRELLRQLPHESVLYLGDTARVPYGPRGKETIIGFALELAEFLLAREVKALVIACNTVSATAAAEIRRISPVPVFDVVYPTVRAAVSATRSGTLGVIGTVTTVRSGIYETLAQEIDPKIRVVGRECPLFVPIAEEHLERHPVARLMAEEYLGRFVGTEADTLIR
jgi:glutamate racemase